MAIFGIDITSLGAAAWLSLTPVSLPAQCHGAPQPPVVNIKVSEGPIRFDTDKTRQQLTDMRAESPIYSPYSPDELHNNLVGGMMSGVLRLDHKMNFVQHYNPDTGDGCLYLDDVEVQLHLSPKVYIAKEFSKDECWFREIFAHELKHLDVDRAISEEYQTRIQHALGMALDVPGTYWSGPTAKRDMQTAKARIKDQVEAILNAAFKSMSEERAYKQRYVDTPEEYAAINNACAPLPFHH